MASPFESSARAAKVARLVQAIDGALDGARILLPEARLDSVAGMGSTGWASAAAVAGVNLPSVETQWAVVRVYEGRVRAAVDAQVAASLAGALKAVAP